MTGRLRISVALCTCEGEKFLREQLESIRAQTRPPEEIVVCDDVSSDGTAEIVERFAGETPFPVRFFRNERRLGSTKNFEKAIGRCTGDVIALSDQDDVWRPGKLARMEEIFSGAPALGAVFTDGEVVDEALQPQGFGLWQAHSPNRFQKICLRNGNVFGALLNHNLATGATMVFRSRFLPMVLPIPGEWVHDGWIALLIAAVAKMEAVPEPLILYRRHERQQIGAERKGLEGRIETAKRTGEEEYRGMAERYGEILDRLRSFGDVSPEILRNVEGKIAHLVYRAERSQNGGSPVRVAKELLSSRYRRYSDGWKSAMKDLFLPVA
jgi:glycosyltransferase involved in cell wall biosynthesis